MFVASGVKLSFVAGGSALSSAIWWSRGCVLPEPACCLEDRQYTDGTDVLMVTHVVKKEWDRVAEGLGPGGLLCWSF